MTRRLPAPIERPVSNDSLIHITCCHDGDVSLCGLDVSADAEAGDDELADCVVCCELDDDDNYCPCFVRCRP